MNLLSTFRRMDCFVCNLHYEGRKRKEFLNRKANLCEEARKLFNIPNNVEVKLELYRDGTYSPLRSPDEIPNQVATLRVLTTEKTNPR